MTHKTVGSTFRVRPFRRVSFSKTARCGDLPHFLYDNPPCADNFVHRMHTKLLRSARRPRVSQARPLIEVHQSFSLIQ